MKKPDINIDFAINTRGQLVQYFVNPLNACYGYIIDGVEPNGRIWGGIWPENLKFTHLENTYKGL